MYAFRFDIHVRDSLSGKPISGVMARLFLLPDDDYPAEDWSTANLTDARGVLRKIFLKHAFNPSVDLEWRLEFACEGYDSENIIINPVIEIPSNRAPRNSNRCVVTYIIVNVDMKKSVSR